MPFKIIHHGVFSACLMAFCGAEAMGTAAAESAAPLATAPLASPVAPVGPRALPGSVPADIASALERARLPRDALVAVVQEVGDASPRWSWRADVPANPASLMKLLTTFAGLELLGPAWTWTTPVWLHGSVAGGVLDGDLVIQGSGDPKLVQERVWLLLRRVQQLGVREIRGDIVIDRSAFSAPSLTSAGMAPSTPADFDAEPLRPYNVRADALLLNFQSLIFTLLPDVAQGVARVSVDPPLAGLRGMPGVPLVAGPCADWRSALKADFSDPGAPKFAGTYALGCAEKSWPIADADPKSYPARVLAGVWQELGGRLTGTVRDGPAPATPPTFVVTSPALAEVVRDINKFSNNVMAQQLFLTLALTRRGSGSPELAREVLTEWAQGRLGSAAAGLVIDNGSGLSRDGRLSANLLAQLLQRAWASPVMAELMSSLPVSGVDGTLKRSRATLGRAHLKTGSLRDVSGVAGYVLGDSGRRYVVVAIVNHPNAAAARPALFDAVVRWAASDAEAGMAAGVAPGTKLGASPPRAARTAPSAP